MNNSSTSQPIRENLEGWITIASSDNDVEILEYKFHVGNFSQAVDIANKISPLVMRYEPLDSEYALRVNLTRWVVEARMSVPSGYWESESQEKLAKNIARIATSQL